jgi:hypothetical protein
VTGLNLTTDQLGAAASYVAREWGDFGYRIEGIESPTSRVSLFYVRASDGSRFVVAADMWGNCRHASEVDWRGYATDETTAKLGELVTVMHEAANPLA